MPEFTRCTGIVSVPFNLDQVRPDDPPPLASPLDCVWFAFTDGSASSSSLPNVRFSSWSVVLSPGEGQPFYPHAKGITPAVLHDIARAETYAVLQALRATVKVCLFVDNRSVVLNLGKILRHGFDLFSWRNQPNLDLWIRIAQEIITRPNGSVQVIKVKSHREMWEAVDAKDAWEIKGNDLADSEAVQARIQVQKTLGPSWQETAEQTALKRAKLCSSLLSDITLLVKASRTNRPCPEEEGQVASPEPQLRVAPSTSPWPMLVPDNFVVPNWDQKWTALFIHYFSLLK